MAVSEPLPLLSLVVVAGVDTHQDIHVGALVDMSDRVIATESKLITPISQQVTTRTKTSRPARVTDSVNRWRQLWDHPGQLPKQEANSPHFHSRWQLSRELVVCSK